MRKILAALVLTSLLAGVGFAQGQTNQSLSSYNVNGPASTAVGLSSPISRSVQTDCPIALNIQAWPNANGFPVVMLFDTATTVGNTLSINAWNMYGIQIDLRDKGANGYTGDQILFDGFVTPSMATWTSVGGTLSTSITLPACTVVNNSFNCITAANAQTFDVSTQALVYDVTAPFGIMSTAMVEGTFINGYQQFTLAGEQSGNFDFKAGFSFRFYGVNYTQAKVSANGFVSFGATDTGFPNPTVASVRSGVPRIMNFYNDLVPEDASYAPATRIYAQQFCDATGLMKCKFVHSHLAEFSDTTGPHGGECVVTDNDDIAVYVHAYQTLPSINTAVGITPGGNIGPSISGFGRDLSAASGTMMTLGAGGHGFEIFDHGSATNNSIDLIGFNNNLNDPVGPGVVFLKDTSLTNTAPANSGYIIQ